jgi:hypothetical protein
MLLVFYLHSTTSDLLVNLLNTADSSSLRTVLEDSQTTTAADDFVRFRILKTWAEAPDPADDT